MSNLSFATVAPRGATPKFQPIEMSAKSSKSDSIAPQARMPKMRAPESTAFETMVDALNPLQQIPGVGQAYRQVSGDKSSNGAQLAGHVAIGAAVAGPIGMAVGAGVFILEKALPGMFGMIGKLFSSGKNSDSRADMPAIIGEPQSSAIAPRRPLIDGLDQRPGTKAARGALPKAEPVSLHQAGPNMSMAQFDALMQSIGAQPIDTSVTSSKNNTTTNSDVAALIQSNLDKYRRAQQQTAAR